MKIFYVYVYLDPRKPDHYKYEELVFNYEPIYVGKGKDDRDISHLVEAKNNVLKNKLKKIQLEKKPIIIRYRKNLIESTAFDIEVSIIKTIGRKDLGMGPLLNLTDGGEGSSGWKCTNKTRKRMSDSQIIRYKNNPISEERRKRISESNRKRKISNETREKMSKSHIGVKHSIESNKKRGLARKGKSHEEIYGLEESKRLKELASRSKSGNKNPMFGVVSSRKGRTYDEIYGKEKSKEIRRKIKEKRKKQIFTTETRERMKESRFNYLKKKGENN